MARNSASSKLPEAEVIIPTSSHLVTTSDNKFRPPISILPDDPEEKRKSVINNVLEQFPYLSSIIAIKISIIFILIVQYPALYAIKIIKKKI